MPRSPLRRVSPLLLLVVSFLPAACQATASGRFSSVAALSGAASASASASSSISVQASAAVSTQASAGLRIRFVRGQLDYTGGVIDFAYDQASLEGERTFQTLTTLRDFLQQHPQVKVRIEGHTDSRGSRDYNRELSTRRAAAIRRWLIEQGIAEARLTSGGLGEDAPKTKEPDECFNKVPRDTTACEEVWAINRRAVFQVTEGAETLRDEPPSVAPVEVSPAATTSAPAVAQEPPRRRWWLGGHAGFELPWGNINKGASIDRYLRGVIPLGLDGGLWLTDRWAVGLGLDYGFGVPASRCPLFDGFCSFGGERLSAELRGEWHSSAGPGPELWLGAAVGFERLSVHLSTARGSSDVARPGPFAALRLGLDVHVSSRVRLGPFLEAAVGRYAGDLRPNAADPQLTGLASPHGWLGLGVRLGVDYF